MIGRIRFILCENCENYYGISTDGLMEYPCPHCRQKELENNMRDNQCKKEVPAIGGFGFRFCARRAWKDGYCKQHHPETVELRKKKQEEKRQEAHSKSAYGLLEKARERIVFLEKEIGILNDQNMNLQNKILDIGGKE